MEEDNVESVDDVVDIVAEAVVMLVVALILTAKSPENINTSSLKPREYYESSLIIICHIWLIIYF